MATRMPSYALAFCLAVGINLIKLPVQGAAPTGRSLELSETHCYCKMCLRSACKSESNKDQLQREKGMACDTYLWVDKRTKTRRHTCDYNAEAAIPCARSRLL